MSQPRTPGYMAGTSTSYGPRGGWDCRGSSDVAPLVSRSGGRARVSGWAPGRAAAAAPWRAGLDLRVSWYRRGGGAEGAAVRTAGPGTRRQHSRKAPPAWWRPRPRNSAAIRLMGVLPQPRKTARGTVWAMRGRVAPARCKVRGMRRPLPSELRPTLQCRAARRAAPPAMRRRPDHAYHHALRPTGRTGGHGASRNV
jgi:hypothetical protein